MDDSVKHVLNGFLNLNNIQKEQLIKAMNEYFNSSESKRKSTKRRIAELAVDLGPIAGIKCPCCGR